VGSAWTPRWFQSDLANERHSGKGILEIRVSQKCHIKSSAGSGTWCSLSRAGSRFDHAFLPVEADNQRCLTRTHAHTPLRRLALDTNIDSPEQPIEREYG
jgi:hypothetical protein